MNFRALLVSGITIGLIGSGSASACEFHGGNFGPPGSGWQAYYGHSQDNTYSGDGLSGWAQEQVEAANRKSDAELFQRSPIARPEFSNAAVRAADTAKSRASLNPFERRLGMQVINELMRKNMASNTYR